MSEADVVRIEKLTVRYGSAADVDGVSLRSPRGGVYALVGRDGAGKSSLVRCLLGQQKPSAGRILLLGEDVWKRRAGLMARVGVVPERPDAPPAMTARQIADFCSRIYSSWDQRGVDRRLARFAIPVDVSFSRLSKGEKQQVLLAVALGHSPELLVLDDPMRGLDVVARRAFSEDLLGNLAERPNSVFLTTHDLAGIEAVATRVGILKDGRLAVDEEIETLKSRFRRIRYGNRMTQTRVDYGTELDLFEAVQVRVRGWGIDAVVSNYDDSSFERFRATDGVVDAQAASMSLEEIFLAVAGEAPASKADVSARER